MLRRVIVQNVGVLKAFNTPNSPTFERLTSFYARNGRGKTTFSTILRAASLNDSVAISARKTLGQEDVDPQVTLIFDEHHVRFADGRWATLADQIEVFDGAFIAENLFAGEVADLYHDRSLFTVILGKEGVRLSRQQEFFVNAAKRTALKLKEAEAALAHDVPGDMTREEFFAFNVPVNLSQQVELAEKQFKRILEAEKLSQLSSLQPLTAPMFNPEIANVLSSTVETIEATARDGLATHFSKHELGREGEGWIKYGLEHIHDDSCPFCGKADVNSIGLISVYTKIFSEVYKTHYERIKQEIQQLDRELGDALQTTFARIRASNSVSLLSLSEYYALGEVQLPSLDQAESELSLAYQALKGLLENKRQAPLIAVQSSAVLTEAQERINGAGATINAYNRRLLEIEGLLGSRTVSATLNEKQAREQIVNLQLRKARNDSGVVRRIEAAFAAKRKDLRAKSIRTIAQGRLKEQNAEGARHYHARVNHYLAQFGAKFSISPISNSMIGNAGSVDYGLIVRGHSVRRGRGRSTSNEPTFLNTLSTGDKTALAFAFFLAKVDRQAVDILVRKVIVFDDPLSSHDTHRQAKTVDLLYDLCRRCCQVIVLSHDAYFLRRLERRCNQVTQISYQIEFEGEGDWSTVRHANIDEICQSENFRRRAKLDAFYHTGAGDISAIAMSIRTVLETHYRSSYPAYFDRTTELGEIIRRIRRHGQSHPCWMDLNDLDSCNAHTVSQHHGDDPNYPSAETIDPDQLRDLVLTCLTLIHARRSEA